MTSVNVTAMLTQAYQTEPDGGGGAGAVTVPKPKARPRRRRSEAKALRRMAAKPPAPPHSELAQAIGQTIRVAREAAGLTQRAVAKALRISSSAVAQWERGASVPTNLNRADLAHLLRIPFHHLMPEGAEIAESVPLADPVERRIVAWFRQMQPEQRKVYEMLGAVLTGEAPPE